MTMPQEPVPEVEELLFGSGLVVDDYYVERTPVAEVICYVDRDGRAFDLHINNEALASAAIAHLLALGVRVVVLGGVAHAESAP
jgi:hypothetical protein